MAEYKEGSMDIREQVRTYNGFWRFWKILFSVIAVVLLYLAARYT